ncbi:hypothetical protein ACFQY0_01140 [Haloferula chungangensis]|uniref:PEP-CTERM sorting domain-containing protein n=1 Tax=Haloferula chungangensis TaxID=1048331 RepID=A0ABW2L3A1_9BACT
MPILTIYSVVVTQSIASITLVDEPFDYPDGNLVGNGTWTAYSGLGNGPVLVSSSQISLAHSSSSSAREDALVQYTAQMEGVITATFSFSVSDDTKIGFNTFNNYNPNPSYFAGFKTGTSSSTSSLSSLLYIIDAGSTPSDTADFRIGIRSQTTAGSIIPGTLDLLYDTTYDVTLSYDFATGQSSATLGGETITTTTPTSSSPTLDGFFFRQGTSLNNESFTVDSLTIVNIPEPTVALLGSLGTLALLRRRRHLA